MKKRLISLLLLLFFLLPAGGAALADDIEVPPTEISDAEGLLALADEPEGSFILTADIDMSALDWTPIPFRGTLDGAGHTLYNLNVARLGEDVRVTRDGNLKSYDTTFAGLFSVLEDARIQDLHLVGAELEIDAQEHCFVGLLAGYMFNTDIQGCSVQGRARLNNYAVQTGIGGLVGYGSGNFGYCTADVELIFEDRNFDSRCEEFMGGILSCGLANITNCTVIIDGYDSCHGYVHNGGLVGMFYYCGMNVRAQSVSENSISGRITFFEDNPNRRAYCAPTLGEELSRPGNYYANESDFERAEVWDYSKVLLPEQCEEPLMSETVTEPDCSSWGHTLHECLGCGYSWIDSYTPPRHTPGDWETVEEATAEHDGLRETHCTLCGALVESETVAYVPPEPVMEEETVTVHGVESSEVLAVPYRGSARAMRPAETTGPLRWSSDDESVAPVDQDGVIRGLKRGETDVRFRSDDGLFTGVCHVTVHYTLWQWFVIVFLFGWLWYI